MKLIAMLDCSRNAVLNISSAKRYIDYLSLMGYQALMLYTEDTYEVSEEPYFGYLRGRYSKDELKEIVRCGKEKNIELIPCIQTLAHLKQIFRWNGYYKINDCDDILLVDEPETYQLIDNLFKNIRECFDSSYINIGMDEAHHLGRGKYLDKHGYQNSNDILLKHLNKVCEIANKYNFNPMMWSDMFYRLASHENYYETNVKMDENVKKLIPSNLTIIYWDYYHSEASFYDKMIKNHLQFASKVAFAGGAWSWIGFAPLNDFTMKVSKEAIPMCNLNNIDTIITTLWKDNGGECSFFSLLPSLFYIKELSMGINDINIIKNDFKKLFNFDFDLLTTFDLLNKPYKDMKYEGTLNPCKVMLYNDPFLGIFDSTVHFECKLRYEEISNKIKALKGNDFDYLVDYYYYLAKVLVYKYELGAKTRKYYKNKNKLKDVIKDYDKSIYYLNKFIKAFRIAWYKENKPHGFDVEEIRLGGLLLRLKSCKERLNLYLDNKISKIEELEEVILPAYGTNVPGYNDYATTATVNKL